MVTDRPELLEEPRQDDLGIQLIGATLASLYMEVVCKAELKKLPLFFLLLTINLYAPGWPQFGRLTPR